MSRVLKVLMLGWEFAPRISGGLGTACSGLARELAQDGVAVVFVLPRSADTSASEGSLRVLACDDPTGSGGGPSGTGTGATGPDAIGTGAIGTREYDPPGARAAVAVAESEPRLEPTPTRRFEWAPRVIASSLQPYQRCSETTEARGHLPATSRGWHQLAHRIAAESRDSLQALATPSPTFDGPPHAEALGRGVLDEVVRYARSVTDLASREDFDVIHAHDWMTYLAATAAAHATGRPWVAHVHSTERDRCGGLPDAHVHALEQLGMIAADAVVCVSERTARHVRLGYRVDSSKIRVVHNGIDRPHREPSALAATTTAEPIVLFLGRMTHQKGPGYFVDAAALVARVRPDVRFVMSGAGDLMRETLLRAAHAGLARRMSFTGFLDREDVIRMYARASVYVMPSVSEPFGIAALEALANEVPVIVSRQSGVAEVLPRALKFDYWDVDDLANKILAVLARPTLATHLRETDTPRLDSMRWQTKAREMKRIYESVLA